MTRPGAEPAREPPAAKRAFLAFALLTIGWIAGTAVIYQPIYPLLVARAYVWWGLIVMAIAAAIYVVLDAARPVGWVRRDLGVNAALLVLFLALLLDALSGFRVVSLRGAGWIAFAGAALHPIVTDLPHRRRANGADPSPAPAYVPHACLAIDWTLAALLLVAQLLLSSW